MRFHLGSRRAAGRPSISRAERLRRARACVLAVSRSTALAERGTTVLATFVVAVLLSGRALLAIDPDAEIPFELYQHHLIVTKGSIGPLNGLSLLIDTGTIPSVVDDRIARKLHLQAELSTLVAFGQQLAVQSAVVNAIRIASVASGPVPVGVGNLAYLQGVRVDAIVGLDVLARRSFSIDYENRVLRFAPAVREDWVAPLEFVWPFLTVRMTIAGKTVRLLVDTGSRDLVLFKARMPTALERRVWRGDKIVQYASGPARLLRLELQQVGLGTHTWDRLPAWSLDRALDGYPPELDGVLGVQALNCKRVQFDFERNELGWSSTSGSHGSHAGEVRN